MHSKWLIILQIFVKVLDIKRRASSCTFEMATILNFTKREITIAQFSLFTFCYQFEHNPKETPIAVCLTYQLFRCGCMTS